MSSVCVCVYKLVYVHVHVVVVFMYVYVCLVCILDLLAPHNQSYISPAFCAVIS